MIKSTTSSKHFKEKYFKLFQIKHNKVFLDVEKYLSRGKNNVFKRNMSLSIQ